MLPQYASLDGYFPKLELVVNSRIIDVIYNIGIIIPFKNCKNSRRKLQLNLYEKRILISVIISLSHNQGTSVASDR